MKVTTTMTELPQIWDKIEGSKVFTVGRGKADYCLWIPGNCGLYYCFRVGDDGMAFGKRAVEPTRQVTIHHNDAEFKIEK